MQIWEKGTIRPAQTDVVMRVRARLYRPPDLRIRLNQIRGMMRERALALSGLKKEKK